MQEFSQKTGASMLQMIVLIVLAVMIAGGGVWYYMDKKASDDKAALQTQINDLGKQVSDLKTGSTTSTTTNTTNSTADATSSWKTYTNAEVGFSFKYPANWSEPNLIKHIVGSNVGSGTEFSNYNNDGPVKADPFGVFLISVKSKGYSNMYGNDFFGQAIDPSWSEAQFVTNIMKSSPSKLEFYRKLDAKTILVGYYQNVECSQSLAVEVVTPLKDTYPNLVIAINENYGADPIISAAESSATANNQDVCSLEPAYKQVADKVNAGTYSEDTNRAIETARLIANSLVVK